MAVQDIAGASSGLGVVDQAKQVGLLFCVAATCYLPVLWAGRVKQACSTSVPCHAPHCLYSQ